MLGDVGLVVNQKSGANAAMADFGGTACVVAVMLVLFWAASPAFAQQNCPVPPAWEEAGTVDSPYQVETLCELQAINADLEKHYELVANIDASPTDTWNVEEGVARGFEPIASGTDTGGGFSGSFVNNSTHVITGLTINRPGTNGVGLFSRLAEGALIRSAMLIDVRTTGRVGVGSLVGYNRGMILGCSVTGVISGGGSVGGLVGTNQLGGLVKDSFVASTVTGTSDSVGGLVGFVLNSTVSNSTATGSVSGVQYVGGLVGLIMGQGGINPGPGGGGGAAAKPARVSNSCAMGSVSGVRNVGGLVGHATNANISNSCAKGSVLGRNVIVGGLVGQMRAGVTVEDSFATGSVMGMGDSVGGLVGLLSGGGNNSFTARVGNSYATGSVMGMGGNVGGLVGNVSNASIGNTYATGWVRGMDDNVGGLVGYLDPDNTTLSSSYHVREPNNRVGFQRSFLQMRCSMTASATCPQENPVTYQGWSTQVWNFGSKTDLPQLLSNANPDLNDKPYIGDPGDQTVRLGTPPGSKVLDFEAVYTGPPGGSVDSTWSLSEVPGGNDLVYFDLGNDSSSITATGSTAKLVVMHSFRPAVDAFVDVFLMNSASVNGDRVRVQIVKAKPPVIAGNSDRRVPESVLSTRLTFTASDTEPGDEANLQWEFLVDGEAMPAIGAVAQFVGPTTGTRVTVELNRPGGKADFGSFVLRVSDPAGASTMVTVNIVPVCAGNGQDLLSPRQDGGGTSADPFEIWTLCQLQDMSSDPSAHYELATSIDAKFATTLNEGAGFSPISSGTENGFLGSFVNNSTHHVITGLTIDRPDTDNVGLFSRLADGAMIRGVILTDARTTGRNNVGSLVGLSAGNIDNSSVTGLVRGSGDNVGGLVGENTGGIRTSFAVADVSGDRNIGGLAGSSTGSASISNSSATGTVSGNNNVGGLVGENNGRISNSFFATGQVKGMEGSDSVGGLVGYSEGNIDNSYAVGSVSGDKNVGGLVGYSEGSIRNSYATVTGLVLGNANNGGLVGSGTSSERVVASYHTGPKNSFGVFRTLEQLQCPIAPGTKCEGEVTYEGWDSRIWDFRGVLPKLKVTPVVGLQGRMRIRVHLGGAAR